METATILKTIDGTGRSITTFVIFDAATALATMQQGDLLEILTDDFEPFRSDIAAWCDAIGHKLVETRLTSTGLRFVVEKGAARHTDSKLAMVISQKALDELLSPLGFALAAALEGIEVHLYFQGPGVKVLTKGFKARMRGWARPFSRFAAAGMTKSGHIPAQDKLRQLRTLGARIYVCGGSLQPFRVKPEDLIFDDLPIVEYLTFMAVMDEADIHLYV